MQGPRYGTEDLQSSNRAARERMMTGTGFQRPREGAVPEADQIGRGARTCSAAVILAPSPPIVQLVAGVDAASCVRQQIAGWFCTRQANGSRHSATTDATV